MASQVYPKFFDAAAEGDIDLLVDTIKAVLVDTADYVFSNAHDFLDDVPAGARVATGTLASITSAFTGDVWTFDAVNLTLTSVTGDPSEAVIFYKDSGVEGTSALISYNELASPVTPNGGNIELQFDASGIVTVDTTPA